MSVTLRLRGRISESEYVITEFLNSQTFDLGDESRRVLGLLSLSQANNRIYRFDFGKAREESCKWRHSGDTLTDHELRLLCDQLRTSGRILRGEGRFDEARSCFESCLKTPELSKSKQTLVKCHLSDLACELEYIQRSTESESILQSQHLSRAREMIEHEIGCERVRGTRSRSLRRLLLCLTEIEIRQDHFNEAECLISELLDIYDTIPEPDIDDRVGHVRTLISKARISQLHEAEGNWTAALLQNKKYNPFEEEVFTCGAIYLFISYTRLQSGYIEGSRPEKCSKSHSQEET